MGFRKRRGVKLPYDQQGLIYFTCKTYSQQPREVQRKILRLCEQAGGDNAEALFVLLTTHRSIEEIMREHYIASDSTLHSAVRRFYHAWGKER